MRKFLSVLLVLVSTLAGAANYNGKYINVAMGPTSSYTSTLQAIPNATITVFNCIGAGNTCGTLSAASLCTSITDTVCNQSNILFSDTQGNFSFYIKPGRYAYNVVGTGFASQTYTDVIINASVFDPGGGGLPGSAQIGDSLRFNTAGDGNWDNTNLVTSYQSMFMNNFGGSVTAFGPYGTSGTNASGFSTGVNATTSLQGGATFASSAVGSPNTVISARAPEGGSSGLMGMLAIYRFSIRLALITTNNSRFWAGVAAYSGGSGFGTNGQQPEGTTSFANDTPNRTMIAFRYSSGVLSNHWAAVTAVGGGSQTTIDTNVVADTNPHLFEWTSNSNGTQYTFFIDGLQVAQSSTNLPTVGTADSGTGLMFWTGDNKNTANSVSASFWSAVTALKY